MRGVNIAVANIKGGVGKTTTAVYLAAAAADRRNGSVVLVDTDRQGSSAEWLEERPIEGVSVVEAPSERTLTRAMSRRDAVVIVARFAWVYPATYLPRVMSKRLRRRDPSPPWQWVFILSFAGLRGAV